VEAVRRLRNKWFLGGDFVQAKRALLTLVLWSILDSSIASTSYAQLDSKHLPMGGAFSGLADDANAAFRNPAGLAQLKSHTFSGIYNTDWKKLDHDLSFALAVPTKRRGAFAPGYTINWDKSLPEPNTPFPNRAERF
jgi:hypothetical protein